MKVTHYKSMGLKLRFDHDKKVKILRASSETPNKGCGDCYRVLAEILKLILGQDSEDEI